MATDIVVQLRELASSMERGSGKSTLNGAANEIERLRGQVSCWEDTIRAIARKMSEANCG